LRGKVVTGDETKHKPAEDWNKLYHSMIEVCIKLGEYSEAIEYIELTKTQKHNGINV
jgi:pentatricopeptide repeat protein